MNSLSKMFSSSGLFITFQLFIFHISVVSLSMALCHLLESIYINACLVVGSSLSQARSSALMGNLVRALLLHSEYRGVAVSCTTGVSRVSSVFS